MAKINQNFDLWAGEDKQVTITVLDVNGVALNITGATIKWGMVDSSNTRVLQYSGSPDIVIATQSGATKGQFTVGIKGNDTKNFPPGPYMHQAFLTDSLGEAEVVTEGQINLKRNINLS